MSSSSMQTYTIHHFHFVSSTDMHTQTQGCWKLVYRSTENIFFIGFPSGSLIVCELHIFTDTISIWIFHSSLHPGPPVLHTEGLTPQWNVCVSQKRLLTGRWGDSARRCVWFHADAPRDAPPYFTLISRILAKFCLSFEVHYWGSYYK